jgi:hypothetical protein
MLMKDAHLTGSTLVATLTARAEGSASDEAHPSVENRRADERGHQ